MLGDEIEIPAAEQRMFRRLLPWPQERPDQTPFEKLLKEVTYFLNRWKALPDGDKPALRVKEIQDLVRQMHASVASLHAVLEPRNDVEHRRLDAVMRLLADEGWNGLQDLQCKLDAFSIAVQSVHTALAAASSRHGKTQFATRATEADLRKIFDEFVQEHGLRGTRSGLDLDGDRRDFVKCCLDLVGVHRKDDE